MEFVVETSNFKGPIKILKNLYDEKILSVSYEDFNIMLKEFHFYLEQDCSGVMDEISEAIDILSTFIKDLSSTIFFKPKVEINSSDEENDENFLILRKQLPFLLKKEEIEIKTSNSSMRNVRSNLIPLNMSNLIGSYAQIIRIKKTLEKEKNEISVDERIEEISKLIKKNDSFEKILKKRGDRIEMKPRKEKVTTFLALLEMAKRGHVDLSQDAGDELMINVK